MRNFEDLLTALKEAGADETLIAEVIAERTKKNEGDKNKRKTNTDIINKLMATFGTEDKNEVVEKATTTSNEVAMLLKKIEEANAKTEEANAKTEELANAFTKEKEDKNKLKLETKIADILTEKKIKPTKTIKAGLLSLVEEGETGLLVGDKSLEDHIQFEFIDSVETVTKKKLKDEKTNQTDVFSSDELDELTPEQLKDPETMAKVDRSLQSLG